MEVVTEMSADGDAPATFIAEVATEDGQCQICDRRIFAGQEVIASPMITLLPTSYAHVICAKAVGLNVHEVDLGKVAGY